MCCILYCLLTIVGSLAWTIVKGPLEALIGVLYGIVCGIILWYLPDTKHVSWILLLMLLLLLRGLIVVLMTLALVSGQSIAISMSVCLSLHSHISKTTCLNFHQIFCTCYT